MPVVVIVEFLFEGGCVDDKIVRGGIKNSVELFQRPLKDFRETGKALVRRRKIRFMLLRQYPCLKRLPRGKRRQRDILIVLVNHPLISAYFLVNDIAEYAAFLVIIIFF